MSDDDDDKPIVVDIGSFSMKAGKGGDLEPMIVHRSVIGRPGAASKRLFKKKEMDKDRYEGDEAIKHRADLKLEYPIDRGVVQHWGDFTNLWDGILDACGDPGEHKFLLTEPPYQPKNNRERLVELFFESFESPALFLVPASVCALTSAGRTTGLVVDSGHGVTHCVPVYESYPVGWAVERLNLGGADVTDFLARLLYERGYAFNKSADKETVSFMKEQHCFVSTQYSADLKREKELAANFKLPDGSVVDFGTERFKASELIFRPEIIGLDVAGVGGITHKSAMACDIDLRKLLLSNITLSGGNACLKGFAPRLKQEVLELAPTGLFATVHVSEATDANAVWRGASISSELPSFSRLWITKEQYEEEGLPYIHKRCFNCVAL